MSIIIFILVLALLIVVHELGHFLAAKWSGVRVDEFGVGYPPRLFSFKPKKSETRYSLNWLPFGGFVSILGENPEEADGGARNMQSKGAFTQIWILAAGVIFNILLGWLLLSIGFMVGMPTSVTYNEPHLVDDAHLTILGVLPDSPAATSDLMANDAILFAESGSLTLQGDQLTVEAFQEIVGDAKDTPLTLLIEREGDTKTVTITPQKSAGGSSYVIGTYLDVVGTVQTPAHIALMSGGEATWNMLAGTILGLGGIIADAFRGASDLDQITGPVGIVGLVGEASALGLVYLMSFTAFISINLAIINLIPFPALDGGRILFVIVESIKGSPIKPKVAQALNLVGFGILILLMVVVTYNDIVRLF